MTDIAPLSAGNHPPAQQWTTSLDGDRLRQLRREHGLSQVQLADLAGMSVATVARLERVSDASCRCRTLARLAAALGEQPHALAAVAHPDGRARSDLP
jgi:transcriptional regulator with XRE-family HTH domain